MVEPPGVDLHIEGICTASGEVRPGDLFVAVKGSRDDGHDHVEEAVARGAAAVLVERPLPYDPGVPTVHTEDGRAALARLAAAWFGQPAADLRFVGITGTVGKTSVLAILERIMECAALPMGSVGSLGVKLDGRVLEETGFTAPDALVLHEALAGLRDAGARVVAMEVTSHALAQQRVHGLTFELGIFTNLLPLEHQDYHGTFESYVETKLRFFDHLPDGAVVVHNADDRAVSEVVRERGVQGVGVGRGADAEVRIEGVEITAEGSRETLRSKAPLPPTFDRSLAPFALDLRLPLLGLGSIYNAGLAATVGMMLGARPEHVQEAVRKLPPPRRRVEVIHQGDFMVIDDTVGHPDSVNAIFEVVGALDPGRVHIAIAIRGSRGAEINQHTAETLAIWCEKRPLGELVVTPATETADERNRVTDEEQAAFVGTLEDAGVTFAIESRLSTSVERVLGAARSGDLVLLLGAQAMDAAGGIARAWLRNNAQVTG